MSAPPLSVQFHTRRRFCMFAFLQKPAHMRMHRARLSLARPLLRVSNSTLSDLETIVASPHAQSSIRAPPHTAGASGRPTSREKHGGHRNFRDADSGPCLLLSYDAKGSIDGKHVLSLFNHPDRVPALPCTQLSGSPERSTASGPGWTRRTTSLGVGRRVEKHVGFLVIMAAAHNSSIALRFALARSCAHTALNTFPP